MVGSIKNLIAAILVSISGFLFWTNVLPEYDHISGLKLVVEERVALLESRNQIVQRFVELRSEYERRYGELQRLAFVVPEKKNLPGMITTVDAISSKIGTTLGELTIGSEGSSPGQASNILSLKINIQSPYESFLNFLGHIEKNLRLIDVNSLTITSKDTSGQVSNPSGGPSLLGIQVEAKAYYLKPPSETRTTSQSVPTGRQAD